MSWEKIELSKVTNYIKRGTAPRYVESGYVILNQKCIRDNTVNFELARKSSKDKKVAKEKFLKTGDTLINSTGKGTLGRVGFVKELNYETIVDTHVTIVRPDKEIINERFLGFQLFSREREIEHLGRGATNQTELSSKDLEKLEINLPPLPTQKKIASILSAYDDLIENNLKRIKLLEEAAQRLYKEWFVDFKFPGHENAVFDEETGLPEGWDRKTIQDLAETIGGGTPSTKKTEYWESGNIHWFSPTDLSKSSSLVLLSSTKKINELGLKKSSAKLLPPQTILMSSRATIGLFGLIDNECSTNQGFINIIPCNENYRYYILFNLINRKSELEANASGATFKELSKTNFRRMSIVNPSEKIVFDFNSFTKGIFKSLKNLAAQNQTLKEARDVLLPRLMNRTIEVKK